MLVRKLLFITSSAYEFSGPLCRPDASAIVKTLSRHPWQQAHCPLRVRNRRSIPNLQQPGAFRCNFDVSRPDTLIAVVLDSVVSRPRFWIPSFSFPDLRPRHRLERVFWAACGNQETGLHFAVRQKVQARALLFVSSVPSTTFMASSLQPSGPG